MEEGRKHWKHSRTQKEHDRNIAWRSPGTHFPSMTGLFLGHLANKNPPRSEYISYMVPEYPSLRSRNYFTPLSTGVIRDMMKSHPNFFRPR
jgi:hypothetical protein